MLSVLSRRALRSSEARSRLQVADGGRGGIRANPEGIFGALTEKREELRSSIGASPLTYPVPRLLRELESGKRAAVVSRELFNERLHEPSLFGAGIQADARRRAS